MLENISYFRILGIPVVIWTGIIALIMILFTASIQFLREKGIKIPIRHKTSAIISIIVMLIHATLAFLAQF